MKKHSALVGIGLVIMVLVLTACGGQAQRPARTTVNVMQASPLQSVDPAHASDIVSAQTMMDVYSGLYRYSNKQLHPDMAARMATISHDQKTYTFHLRRNARWSDGRHVTAQDFVYAWRRAVNPATKSPYAYAFNDIVNAQAIGAGKMSAQRLGVVALTRTTLRVRLTKAVPYFESMLTMSVFDPVERTQVTKYGSQYGTSAATLTFNGPYRLTKWRGKGAQRWVETKNPTYWRAHQVHLHRVTYRVVKSSQHALKLFRQGQLDDITVSGSSTHKAKKMTGYHVVKQNIATYLELNQARVPALKNQSVRQSLALAINRAGLIRDVLGDGSQPLTTIVPAGMFYNEQSGADFATSAANGVSRYSKYDLERARKLFKAGMAATGQTQLTLTVIGADTDSAKATLQYLQRSLAALSQPQATVTVKVVPLSLTDRLARLRTGNFDLALTAWSADYPDPATFLNLFTTGNSNNHAGWSNTKYDQLVNAAQTTDAGNVTHRWHDLLAADQLLTRSVATIPLYQVGQARVRNPQLHARYNNPNGLVNWATAYYQGQ
ncbi:peptide ABC transporter substrate-binding protein [Lacticaseibacillus thailandensis]|nr:peptide ABC transporter substrate-binding protein [Lacticaseibacillus thailandensis]